MNLKHILCLLGLLLVFTAPNAQTALAKLKFEDAETAFNNQDYAKAAQKLDEAEKLFGKTNAPIAYLRILLMDKQLPAEPDWAVVKKLLINCENYLKEYENVESLEEKYRQVYKVYASVTEKFGSNEEEFKAYFKKQEDIRLAKMEAENNRPAKVYVFRQTGFAGMAAPMGIFINDTMVCKLFNGDHSIQILPKGEYKIRIKGVLSDGKRYQKLMEKYSVIQTFLIEPKKTYYLDMKINAWNGKMTLEVLSDEAGFKKLKETKEKKCAL